MGVMRDMEIVWDDLLDAFENPDPEMIYFLDRQTGEVFYVPADYEDDAFWDEIDADQERYLAIPYFDYDQERLLLHEFIKGVANEKLKTVLNRTFIGKSHTAALTRSFPFTPKNWNGWPRSRNNYWRPGSGNGLKNTIYTRPQSLCKKGRH